MKPTSADRARSRGFTLLELTVAITLFALIIVYVLADREKSIGLSADARIIQTVEYLAAAKMDEIRNDPDRLGDSDGGDFDDLKTDAQSYDDYSWEVAIERVVVAGKSEDRDDSYLYEADEEAEAPTNGEGKEIGPRYVRRATLTVRYEPGGDERADLSVVIRTFLPPEQENETAGGEEQ
jgi:prepilin-type N-terminal cleavage/methylation domain-containing protein